MTVVVMAGTLGVVIPGTLIIGETAVIIIYGTIQAGIEHVVFVTETEEGIRDRILNSRESMIMVEGMCNNTSWRPG